MKRSRLLVALIIAVILGLAVGWLAKRQAFPGGWQDRARAAVLDLEKKLHHEPMPPRQ